jgi:hypothetical protein
MSSMPDGASPLPGKTARLRATIVIEYDAVIEDYVQDGGSITPAEMAAMDASMTAYEMVEVGMAVADPGDITTKVEAI